MSVMPLSLAYIRRIIYFLVYKLPPSLETQRLRGMHSAGQSFPYLPLGTFSPI
jgi:hypothetical protein